MLWIKLKFSWACLVLLIFTIPSIGFSQLPANHAKSWTADNMMLVNSVHDVTISPNGKLVAYAVSKYIRTAQGWKQHTQIYVTNIATKQTRQYTFTGNNNHEPQWSPNGKWLAFLAGSTSINIMRVNGGGAWPAVTGNATISEFKWSPNSKMIAYNQATPATQTKPLQPIIVGQKYDCNNIWFIQLDDHGRVNSKPQNLTHYAKPDHCQLISGINWSPDNNHIVFSHSPPDKHDVWNYGKIATVNINDQKITSLVKQKIIQHNPVYSPNGKYIAFSGRFYVYVLNLATNSITRLAQTYDQQPMDLIGWSNDSKTIYICERYHTYTHLIALSADGKTATAISPADHLINDISLNVTNTWFGFTMQTSSQPIEAFVSQANTFKPIQVSFSNANLPKLPLGKTVVIRWHSQDGTPVEGLLTYPVNYQTSKRYPLLVELHGGPDDSFLQRFIARPSVFPISVFSAQGYFYLRINFRGTSGYGLKFRELNRKHWGKSDAQDVLTGIKHLQQQQLIDPKRIGLLGWSYGGYLTAWLISQTHQFKAAIIGGGITDLISYTGTSDLPNFVPNALGSYFWQDRQLYLAQSPIFYVQNIKTPTLLLYGEKDFRVPPTQGYELYNALKLLNVPVKFILYPETYHSIRIPNLIVSAAKTNIDWLNQYVHK